MVSAASFALPRPAPVTARPAPPLPVLPTVAWALAIALAMSVRLLLQPFVWRNWSPAEIAVGWLQLALDRTIVTLAIAVALLAASRVYGSARLPRAPVLVGAVVSGATAGEFFLRGVDPWGAASDIAGLLLRVGHWTLIVAALAAMHSVWGRWVQAREATQAEALRAAELQRRVDEARLLSLQRQIEPHFLFNTLATLRYLQGVRPEEGARMLASLLDYLRLSHARSAAATCRLGDEITLVEAYLRIVASRMSGRLTFHVDVPGELRSCGFPPLALATLVENAVKHGIGPRPDGGTVEVVARRDGDDVEVTVNDDGVGFADKLGGGIGLVNLRARLAILYGARGRLVLAGHAPGGVRAAIRVPFAPREAVA